MFADVNIEMLINPSVQPVVMATATRRKSRPAGAGLSSVILQCTGTSQIRSNDGTVTSRDTQDIRVNLDFRNKTGQVFGVVPTLGGELIFKEPQPLTITNGIASFQSAPLGPERTTAPLQIDLNSGAMSIRNRHLLGRAFGAIPLYNTFEMAGYCKPLNQRLPIVPRT
ncbi:MAG TPA: hypothetical protein VFV30_05030 [Novosphingobium sp.]|nr:hypothetical protein [Novosphingobium sp.]